MSVIRHRRACPGDLDRNGALPLTLPFTQAA
jgi:hypothetical protein